MNKLKLLLLIAPFWVANLPAVTIYPNERLERLDVFLPEATLYAPKVKRIYSDQFTLEVPGAINSFTILPFIVDLAHPTVSDLPTFEFSYRPIGAFNSSEQYPWVDSLDPMTFFLPDYGSWSRIDFDVAATLRCTGSYWLEHRCEVVYGYTIKSVPTARFLSPIESRALGSGSAGHSLRPTQFPSHCCLNKFSLKEPFPPEKREGCGRKIKNRSLPDHRLFRLQLKRYLNFSKGCNKFLHPRHNAALITPTHMEEMTHTADEYAKVRETVGSQRDVARMLGVDIRTVQRREGKEVPILYEAELALRYVCLKSLGREPETSGNK